MGKRVLAVVAGIFVAGLIVFVFEAVGHGIWPPPPGIDVSNPEALKNLMPSIPLGAKIAVVVAWVFGAFGGGYVAARIGKNARLAWIVGVVQIALGVFTMLSIPHPLAMWITGILLPLPAAMLGGHLGASGTTQQAS